MEKRSIDGKAIIRSTYRLEYVNMDLKEIVCEVYTGFSGSGWGPICEHINGSSSSIKCSAFH
jgi:hypothetical protein